MNIFFLSKRNIWR